MTQDELQNIINKLEELASTSPGTFGIYQYGGGPDESFIKANKEGLLLFANELLRAAKDADKIITDPAKKIIPLSFESAWIDEGSNTFVQYIEPVNERQKEIPETNKKATFFNKLIPLGCIVTIIVLIAALGIGLWTLAKWIF